MSNCNAVSPMRDKCQQQELEEALLVMIERVTDRVYRRFIEGELSQQDLERLNAQIRHWSTETEKILQLAEFEDV